MQITTMTLIPHNKHFFKLLLVIYFLAYSISPLTYTLSHKQASEHICAPDKESSGIKSAQILLWESFMERLSSLEENPHSNGDASILIKKKRALAPENVSAKLFLLKNTPAPKDFCKPPVPMAYGSNVIPANVLDICKGFNPLYAGNSPPSV